MFTETEVEIGRCLGKSNQDERERERQTEREGERKRTSERVGERRRQIERERDEMIMVEIHLQIGGRKEDEQRGKERRREDASENTQDK